MPVKVTEEQYIWAWQHFGSPEQIAGHFGLNVRGVYAWRDRYYKRTGVYLETRTSAGGRPKITVPKTGFRAYQENVTGTVLIGGDLHAWPGERSKAFGAYIELVKELKPSLIIINGDVFDGARISRHPPGGWASLPTVADELEAVKERLAEIESVAPEGCPLILPAGNHDSRFSARLAASAPEYIQVKGFDLADHLPAWQFCWSIWLNDSVVVKHRYHQGVHAAYNNTVKAGKTMVTNHTHALLVRPFSDYNGTRYGVECGTLSEFGPENDKFSYAEDNPVNWGAGFAVLTFDHNGMLLEPEICRVINKTAYFRGQIVVS